MEFSVLGPLEVRDERGPLTVPGAKERTLLVRLLVDVNRPVRVEALIEELWAEHPPRSAAKSLQTFVARLRTALDQERAGPGSILRCDQAGYRLSVPRTAVDTERFQDLLTAGRAAAEQGQPETARRLLASALDLWRGPALPELADRPMGRAESHRLDGLRAAAVEHLAAADLALGDRATAAAELERLLIQEPLRESAAVLLMAVLHADGRAADALAVYARIRRRLVDDLGLEPGPELVALHGRVLSRESAGRPTDQWARMTVADRAASEAVGADALRLDRRRQELRDGILATGEWDQVGSPDPQHCPWRGLRRYEIEDSPWFAGRERLVAELLACLAGSRVLAVVGPSGSGKSSVLRAGLLAALAGGALPGSASWTAGVMRPSLDPLGAVADLFQRPASARPTDDDAVDASLNALIDPAGPPRLIAVDQAEELWTGNCAPADSDRFLDLLAAAAADERAETRVVIVIRPDYLGHLSAHPALARLLAERIVLVPHRRRARSSGPWSGRPPAPVCGARTG